MNTNTQVVTIDFHGQPMIAIKNGDEIHVAMKPIAEAIGLQWEAQYKRINRHPVMSKGMSMMDIPSDGGIQQTATLPLKMLNGWLFGIDANRVKPECCAKLIEYQTECFDVLAGYFMQGEAINPRFEYAVNPGDSLTKEQADTLRQMNTDAAIKAHPNDTKKQGVMIRAGWSKLKAHFKVSYRDIPQSEFIEAVSIISRHAVEGEYLPKQPAAAVDPEITQELLDTLATRELLKPGRRFMTLFSNHNAEPMPVLYAISPDALILSDREFITHVSNGFPANLLPALIQAGRLVPKIKARLREDDRAFCFCRRTVTPPFSSAPEAGR